MDNYGDVNVEKLSTFHGKVKTMVSDPTMPVDNIYNAIQDFISANNSGIMDEHSFMDFFQNSRYI